MKRDTRKLTPILSNLIQTHAPLVASILKQSLQGLGFTGGIIPFEESIQKYNQGITDNEIKAWVWYRRSLGIPMYGWDSYYLSNTGATTQTELLVTNHETTLLDNHFRPTQTVPSGTILGKSLHKSHTPDKVEYLFFRDSEGIKLVNKSHASTSKTQKIKTNTKALEQLVKSKALFYVDGELLPYAAFTYGNMYDRLLAIQQSKTHIIQTYGQAIHDHHLNVINQVKPRPLSIANPIAQDRPRILAISKFSQDFTIENLRDETGVILKEKSTLQEAFKDWLRSLPETDFLHTKPFEIINYYLNGDSKPRSMEKIEWQSIQKHSRDEAEKLYIRFLYEAIPFADQQKIDLHWNRTYNAHSSLQYHKIPIGLEVSSSFHGFEFDIRPAQREGIAFMELVGSGIIAYDVGVGKTITAIIELANAIKSGKCTRPLVVVPNPTYKNWIKEMLGFDDKAGVLTGTGITFNEWYNLGTDILKKIKLNQSVPKNSITLVTYEGLMKIGFGEGTENALFMELSNILEQDSAQSQREQEKRYEKYRELLGVGLKDTLADIEVLGFDYMVIDEAHNFKNVFSEVKSEPKEEGGDGKKRFHIRGGSPSSRAIKAFFLCNYIQRTFGRNVMLLTATPFTNSPLEIYSMLSLVGYHYLKSMGMYNIGKFFEQYVLETTEYVVDVDGEIKESNVVKTFNNRISLQKLIHNHINFKTGEEAGIPRPCKINLPKTTTQTEQGEIKRLQPKDQVLTYLQMTERQQRNQQIIAFEAAQGVTRDDPGRLLRIMNQSLNNALSPFLYEGIYAESPEELIEESPKIKYTLDCVRSVKIWHEQRGEPVSGQVIYLDRGKDLFPLIKAYLEQEVGYAKSKSLISNPRQKVDEVEIITGGISQAKKEKIKTAFNEGVCKVLIGTSTIREGINLQKKGTVLYNLYPNWNPTDIRQLEGRIWRQKNEFGYVRISMPLVENSMDVFVFQKLEEKTSRINDIWSKSDRGNVLDEESLDTNAVKFALITDLGVLMRFESQQEQKELNRKQSILKSNIKDLKEFQGNYSSYINYRTKVLESFQRNMKTLFRKTLFSYTNQTRGITAVSLENPPSNSDLKQMTKVQEGIWEDTKDLYERGQQFMVDSNQEDKALLQLSRSLNRMIEKRWNWELERFKDYLSKYKKTERSLLEPRGYTIQDDFDQIIAAFEKELDQVGKEKDLIQSEAYQKELMEEIAERKKKLEVKGGSVSDRVKEFASLNHLLSYRFSDIDHTSCVIPSKEFSGRRNIKKEVSNAKRHNLLQLKSKSRKRRIRILTLE